MVMLWAIDRLLDTCRNAHTIYQPKSELLFALYGTLGMAKFVVQKFLSKCSQSGITVYIAF